MSESVVAALRIAATERPDPAGLLGVTGLLDALSRADTSAEWDRVLLHLGEPLSHSEPASTRDGGLHDGVALSGALCDALEQARALMQIYSMPVLEPGLLGVALVHALERSDVATSNIDYRAAERAVVDDVLGIDLADLDRAIAETDLKRALGDAEANQTSEALPATLDPDRQGRALLESARACCHAGGEPGAAELLEAVSELKGPVRVMAQDLQLELGGRSSTAELAGIPDTSAATILASAMAHPMTGTLPVDAALLATTAPSWKVFEMLHLDGCRPVELATAIGLAETDALDEWSLLGREAERWLRWPLRIWVAYMMIRHHQFATAAVLLVPMVRAPTAPPWVSLVGTVVTFACFGWVPAVLAGVQAAVAAAVIERDRRRLRDVLHARVSGATFRRVLRIVDDRRSGAIDLYVMARSVRRQRNGTVA